MSDRIDQLATAFDTKLGKSARHRICALLDRSWLDANYWLDSETKGLVHDAVHQGHWYARWAACIHSPESIGGLLVNRPNFDEALQGVQKSLGAFTLPEIVEIGEKKDLRFIEEGNLWLLLLAAINSVRYAIDKYRSGYVTAEEAGKFLKYAFVDGFWGADCVDAAESIFGLEQVAELSEGKDHVHLDLNPESLGFAPGIEDPRNRATWPGRTPFLALPTVTFPDGISPECPDAENIWKAIQVGSWGARGETDELASWIDEEARVVAHNRELQACIVIAEGRALARRFADRRLRPPDPPHKPPPDPQRVADHAAAHYPLDQRVDDWDSHDDPRAALLRTHAWQTIVRWWPNRTDYWTIDGKEIKAASAEKRATEWHIRSAFPAPSPLSPEGQLLSQEIMAILACAYGRRLLASYADYGGRGSLKSRNVTWQNTPPIHGVEIAWQWTRATWRAAHDIASNWDFEMMSAERVDEIRADRLAKGLRLSKGVVRTPVWTARLKKHRTEILDLVVAEAREGDPYALMVVEAIPARARPNLR